MFGGCKRKVEQLALNILHSDKMSSDEIIRHLASAIDDGIECGEEYKELYEHAYGNKLSNEVITDWVKSMAVTDGSEREHGQKWSVDQCYEVGQKIGFDFNKHSKYDWYAVMNMMYSDNFKTAKAFSLHDDPMFYARLAKDWLCDSDAMKNKLFNYYFSVVCC